MATVTRRRGSSRTSGKPENQERPRLTVPREQLEVELDDRMAKGLELLDRPLRAGTDLVADLGQAFHTWNEYNIELLRKRFTTSEIAEEYQRAGGPILMGASESVDNQLKDTREDIGYKQRKLESIKERLPLFDHVEPVQTPAPRELTTRRDGGKTVFIVHGHDERTKQEVARFLERLTPLDARILHEQPNQGRTVIEKFEDYAADAAFAVILLTGDDVGGVKATDDEPQSLNPRPRQNVVFELGFFIGALGREHVAVLYEEGVERPSDIAGVAFTPLDSRGAWKAELARELRAAGIEVDTDALL
jgi:predicted nucleotide-binding protein